MLAAVVFPLSPTMKSLYPRCRVSCVRLISLYHFTEIQDSNKYCVYFILCNRLQSAAFLFIITDYGSDYHGVIRGSSSVSPIISIEDVNILCVLAILCVCTSRVAVDLNFFVV